MPLSPTVALSADALLSGVLNRSGGNFAEIAGYRGGQWTAHRYDDRSEGLGFGGSDDFALGLATGYALYSDEAASFVFSGLPAGSTAVPLTPGWNLVGCPDALAGSVQAYGILSSSGRPDRWLCGDRWSGR